jgi:hypothetical protein
MIGWYVLSAQGGKMKKIASVTLILCLFLSLNCYAANNSLTAINARLMQESASIKSLLKDSKDVVLLTTMWDSYFISRTQLDAYFYMVALYESVKKGSVTEASVGYLLNWLGEIRKTNATNMKSLNSAPPGIDQATKLAVNKMKAKISDLNSAVDSEIVRLNSLKESLRKNSVR